MGAESEDQKPNPEQQNANQQPQNQEDQHGKPEQISPFSDPTAPLNPFTEAPLHQPDSKPIPLSDILKNSSSEDLTPDQSAREHPDTNQTPEVPGFDAFNKLAQKLYRENKEAFIKDLDTILKEYGSDRQINMQTHDGNLTEYSYTPSTETPDAGGRWNKIYENSLRDVNENLADTLLVYNILTKNKPEVIERLYKILDEQKDLINKETTYTGEEMQEAVDDSLKSPAEKQYEDTHIRNAEKAFENMADTPLNFDQFKEKGQDDSGGPSQGQQPEQPPPPQEPGKSE